jgi:hypothetical protein
MGALMMLPDRRAKQCFAVLRERRHKHVLVQTLDGRDEVMVNPREESKKDAPSPETILAAFEKLFDPVGQGIRRYQASGLRYVNLTGGAVLVEQNPRKRSHWAVLANRGHRVAWVLRDGKYLARIIDGEVEMLHRAKES